MEAFPTRDSLLAIRCGQWQAMKHVFLSLGSNVGDRRTNIGTALEQLRQNGVEVQRVSSLYRTQPVGYTAQPWFVNCVAEVATDLMPLQLLRRSKAIERGMGRRPGPKNGPRPIDIDILLYENVVMRSAELTIPHPRLAERRFVLVPLSEVAPDIEHPLSRLTVRQMLQATPDTSQVIKLESDM